MVLDNSALNNLEHRCEQLKPWTEYVIQMTQQELDEHFRKTIQKTWCDIKLKNWKIIIVKKQEEEDPLAWWWDINADMKKIDEKTHKEAEQAKKEAEQEKIYLALANYGEEFAKTLLNTLKWIQKNSLTKHEIIKNLKIMKKDVYAWNIVPSEKVRLSWLNWLETIQMIYKKDKTINNLIKQIIKKLNSYEVNPGLA